MSDGHGLRVVGRCVVDHHQVCGGPVQLEVLQGVAEVLTFVVRDDGDQNPFHALARRAGTPM